MTKNFRSNFCCPKVPELLVGRTAACSWATRADLARPPLAGEYGRLRLLKVIGKDKDNDMYKTNTKTKTNTKIETNMKTKINTKTKASTG